MILLLLFKFDISYPKFFKFKSHILKLYSINNWFHTFILKWVIVYSIKKDFDKSDNFWNDGKYDYRQGQRFGSKEILSNKQSIKDGYKDFSEKSIEHILFKREHVPERMYLGMIPKKINNYYTNL